LKRAENRGEKAGGRGREKRSLEAERKVIGQKGSLRKRGSLKKTGLRREGRVGRPVWEKS